MFQSICGTAVFLAPRGWRAVLSTDGLGCAAGLCSISFLQMLRRAWWGPDPPSDLHPSPADPAPPSPALLLLALALLADATQALVQFQYAFFWRGSLVWPCLGSPGRMVIGRPRGNGESRVGSPTGNSHFGPAASMSCSASVCSSTAWALTPARKSVTCSCMTSVW